MVLYVRWKIGYGTVQRRACTPATNLCKKHTGFSWHLNNLPFNLMTTVSAGKRWSKTLRKLGWRKRSRYRSIPGNWAQFKLLFRRAGVKWVRGWGYKFIDLLLFVTAALVVGKFLITSVKQKEWGQFHAHRLTYKGTSTNKSPDITHITARQKQGKDYLFNNDYNYVLWELQTLLPCVIGAAHGTAWEIEKVRGNVTLAMLTLAIISVIASLGVFGKDRLVFCRETSSGKH